MKKLISKFMVLVCMVMVLSGCTSKVNDDETSTSTNIQSDTEVATQEAATENIVEPGNINIGSLKGPTSIGLVDLMDKNENNLSFNKYNFTMVTGADELVAKLANKEIDVALIPANLAAVVYNNTEGSIKVLNINTLGVLYILENGNAVNSIEDLKGKTIYMTGKGTTPEYVFNYLLTKAGLTAEDVTIEFKSEATEVAAVLAQDSTAIGLLPQPFATVAMNNNEELRIALDITKEWDKAQGENGTQLVTGVTVVRKEFLEENQQQVMEFLKEYQVSAEFVNNNVEAAAELVGKYEIVAAPVAVKAIPYCNICNISDEEMKQSLNAYLQVIYEQNENAVGGKIPEDDFYYISK